MAIESVTLPVIRPPAMACEISSGGVPKRRLQMMVSSRINRANQRLLMAVAALAALFVLPTGLTHAQDYEAVGRRLRQAVAAGELSGEQARLMLEALRLAEQLKPSAENKLTREQYGAVEAELKRLVEKGELSPENARARLQKLRQAMAVPAVGHDRTDGHNQAAEGTQESGRERARWPVSRESFAQMETELRMAVESGRISKEDAKKVLEIIGPARSAGDGSSPELVMARRIMAALVEAGIDREDAAAVLGAIGQIVAGIEADGAAYALNPRIGNRLNELGINGEQIKVIVDIARRLAASRSEESGSRDRNKRMP
jgi:polyhydroxyalkanoate synthesis regulator phasin